MYSRAVLKPAAARGLLARSSALIPEITYPLRHTPRHKSRPFMHSCMLHKQDTPARSANINTTKMKEENVHALKYREAKPPQGDPAAPVERLFRLDGRTIVGTGR